MTPNLVYFTIGPLLRTIFLTKQFCQLWPAEVATTFSVGTEYSVTPFELEAIAAQSSGLFAQNCFPMAGLHSNEPIVKLANFGYKIRAYFTMKVRQVFS